MLEGAGCTGLEDPQALSVRGSTSFSSLFTPPRPQGRPFQLLPGILGMPQLEGRRELRRRMDGGMEES